MPPLKIFYHWLDRAMVVGKFNQHVDVVGHHGQAHDPPVIHFSTFVEQLLHVCCYVTDQDSLMRYFGTHTQGGTAN